MVFTDYKKAREDDVNKIITSKHPRKVVVAGPGTGKSYLFEQIIKSKKQEGKDDFIAITFIGKLGDALADDLCGLAPTYTMHGYARKLFLENNSGWNYYPKMHAMISEDLQKEGIKSFTIGDSNYKKKSEYYKAVGDADVVYYTVKMCTNDNNIIPKHDLILVDEFQDFNEIEAKFIDVLSASNEMVIVGDDDQALYGFKGSSPKYIREKYDISNTSFESHTLRFCSRCTNVIIKNFHAIVNRYKLNDIGKNRIPKEYICYIPDKEKDSEANSKIHLITGCPPGMLAFKIKKELEQLTKSQKIKQVLVLGEGRSCASVLSGIATQLVNYGFKNIDYKRSIDLFPLKQDVIDAYRFLAKENTSLLAWRILGNPTDQEEKAKHLKNSIILDLLIKGTASRIKSIKDSDIELLEKEVGELQISDKELRKSVLFKNLKNRDVYLSRPLSHLDIAVCNILNAKGLSADIVFVVGFDQGRFPSKSNATDSEVYQMLVALTRAKKRIYFINTIRVDVSSFIDCIDVKDLVVEKMKIE